MPGLERLIELQQTVKTGSLSVDEAADHFRGRQQVQKDVDNKKEVCSLKLCAKSSKKVKSLTKKTLMFATTGEAESPENQNGQQQRQWHLR